MRKTALALAILMLIISTFNLAAFAEPDTVSITFRTENGMKIFNKLYGSGYTDEVTITRDRGYVLTEKDVPIVTNGGIMPFPFYCDWEVDPVGVAVNEDITFTLLITRIPDHIAIFCDWDGNEISRQQIPSGGGACPPELEDKDGMMVHDWVSENNSNYHSLQEDAEFHPVGVLRGDVNHNDQLDVGDATLILRTVVGLDDVDYNADFNKNGIFDAGDAAGILRVCVEE